MTPGNFELVRVLVSWAVTLPAVTLVITRDERRLTGVALERAWPPQSRDAAIFGLWNLGVHPLCVVVHFARTRRSLRGVILGLGWLAAIWAAATGAELAAAAAVDWLGL